MSKESRFKAPLNTARGLILGLCSGRAMTCEAQTQRIPPGNPAVMLQQRLLLSAAIKNLPNSLT